MSIDLSKVTALSDQYGAWKQVADASGRVLWSSTIKFTINGDTYIADRGMTWAEWFASAYNTTGKTADDVQSISANGAAVELSAVIVGGTAYEAGFGPPPATVTITGGGNADVSNVQIDGVTHSSPTTLSVPIGTVVTCYAKSTNVYGGMAGGYITLNGPNVAKAASPGDSVTYEYTVSGDVTINLYVSSTPGGACGGININEQ